MSQLARTVYLSILYNRPCEEVFETMYNLIEKCHCDNKLISSDDFLLLPMGNDHYNAFARIFRKLRNDIDNQNKC